MEEAVVVQRAEATPAAQRRLLLMFHGVGSSAQDLRPLAQALAARQPDTFVVSVNSPQRSEWGSGWQWFSVQGITEENRPARVAAAMPGFVETVRRWQHETGVDAQRTALLGFSQGAIMALESTQAGAPLAAQVFAIAGRFAQAPRAATPATTIHLFHGDRDQVMPLRASVEAEAQLRALGTPATLDTFAGLGHGLDARVVDSVLRRMAG